MEQNTVFIIGAGASKEVGLPIGSELKDDISHMLNIQYDAFSSNQTNGDFEIAHAPWCPVPQ